MNKKISFSFFICIIMLLSACGTTNEDIKQTDEKATVDEMNENNNGANNTEDNETTELPEGFPADFPFPDDITITEVRDESEDNQKKFTIRFTFNPDMDLETVFDMYADYADKIGYESLLEGEEYFTDDIYQYTAMRSLSTANMFVITMKPTDGTYGSIDVKFEE